MKNCAYSIKTIRVREPDFPYTGQRFTCAEEVVSFLRSLQSADVEKLVTLYLDNQNGLICIQVQSGIVNQAVIYPREIIRHALLVNASIIVLAHNHPAGSLKPSVEDHNVLKRIVEACKLLEIVVHDNIIIGGDTGQYISFYTMGLMP